MNSSKPEARLSAKIKDMQQANKRPPHQKPTLTTQLVIMTGILLGAFLLGYLWNFRATGIILAITLFALAGFRLRGYARVFSARSPQFDALFMVSAGIILLLFSFISPD